MTLTLSDFFVSSQRTWITSSARQYSKATRYCWKLQQFPSPIFWLSTHMGC
jgi:hypothetical protein